jgi:hypothetical protein
MIRQMNATKVANNNFLIFNLCMDYLLYLIKRNKGREIYLKEIAVF